MTTIVWDGSSVSWDSQLTAGDVKLRGEKGRRVSTPTGEALVVVAGYAGALDAVCKLVSRGQDPTPALNEDTTAVVLTHRGLKLYDDGKVSDDPGPSAYGTGMMAAYTGLHLGYNSRKACLLACEIDLHSSGPVHTVFKSKLRRAKKTTPKSDG